MSRLFQYVGTPEIFEGVKDISAGRLIESSQDVLAWIEAEDQSPVYDLYWSTYIVSENGRLRIGDRHTEHVACSGRKPVLAAGEMAFEVEKGKVEVIEVSNLSTGFCPRADCWPPVKSALDKAGISVPDEFTYKFEFRKCMNCGQRNTIKDDQYYCSICEADLPAHWNFAD